MRFSILIIILIHVLVSCDPHVEVESITPEKLLSVSCFISPQDTVFTAYVYRGSRHGSTINLDSAAVKDARVTLSDGIASDTLTLTHVDHPITGIRSYRYVCRKRNVNVIAGGTYYLRVETPAGGVATSNCTIPPEASTPIITGERVGDDYHYTIAWSAPRPHKYFVLDVTAEGFYEVSTPDGPRPSSVHTRLPDSPPFPSDAQLPYNEYQGILGNAYVAESPLLRVTVKNIEEGLFKYFRSYAQYQDWNSNNSGNMLPNFRPMPLIHSNVDGGVGYFGGYNQTAVEVYF